MKKINIAILCGISFLSGLVITWVIQEKVQRMQQDEALVAIALASASLDKGEYVQALNYSLRSIALNPQDNEGYDLLNLIITRNSACARFGLLKISKEKIGAAQHIESNLRQKMERQHQYDIEALQASCGKAK